MNCPNCNYSFDNAKTDKLSITDDMSEEQKERIRDARNLATVFGYTVEHALSMMDKQERANALERIRI